MRLLFVMMLLVAAAAGARASELGAVSDDEWSLWYCGVLYQTAAEHAPRRDSEHEAYKMLSKNFFKAAALLADPSVADIDTKVLYIRRMNSIVNGRSQIIREIQSLMPELSPPTGDKVTPPELERCNDAANLPAFNRALSLGMFLR